MLTVQQKMVSLKGERWATINELEVSQGIFVGSVTVDAVQPLQFPR